MKKIPIYELIETLIDYGLSTQLMAAEDVVYVRNSVYHALSVEAPLVVPQAYRGEFSVAELMEALIDWAYDAGILQSKYPDHTDVFDTQLMDLLTPRPSEVTNKFMSLYSNSSKEATDWFYKFSISTQYIRMKRVSKNINWQQNTKYGDMVISINRSKPEKDPKVIIEAAKVQASQYPLCLLCYENVGYYGHSNHPARQTHRVIPLTLGGEPWFFQYSPYVYYNEHAIVISKEHTPMAITPKTFERLADFVDQFPHYFVGSNADLPIVGGSMLAHDHYQAGCYEMPMAKAAVYKSYALEGFKDVQCQWLRWPLTALRMASDNRSSMIEAAVQLTHLWRRYTDEQAALFAVTENEPHHSITPILRKRGGLYELDVVLRDNRRSEAFPDGIYHPHPEIHPVKKENIGLIEVMGLAVLPDRLAHTMEVLAHGLKNKLPFEALERDCVNGFEALYKRAQGTEGEKNALRIVKSEVGAMFVQGLEHCGVMKNTQAGEESMNRFMNTLNQEAVR